MKAPYPMLKVPFHIFIRLTFLLFSFLHLEATLAKNLNHLCTPSKSKFTKSIKINNQQFSTNKESNSKTLIKKAIELLTSKGTRWEYHPRSSRIIIIRPDSHGSFLNKLSAAVYTEMLGLKIEFDPHQYQKQGEIFYDETNHRIIVDIKILESDRLTPSFVHELRHAQHAINFYEGKFELFSGSVETRSKKIVFHPLYPDIFSLDETITYAYEAHEWALNWIQAPEGRLFPTDELLSAIQTGEQLNHWSIQTLLSAQQYIKTLESQFSKLIPEQSWIHYKDKYYLSQLWKLSPHTNNSLELYEISDKNLLGKSQPITYQIISFDHFKISLFSAIPITTGNSSWWLSKLKTKINKMIEITKRSELLWKEFQDAVRERSPQLSLNIATQLKKNVSLQLK